MNPKVYKAKSEYDIENVKNMLEKNAGFEKVGKPVKDQDKDVRLSWYRELNPKSIADWITELELFFQIEPKFEQYSNQYNAIMVVETSKSIYLIPNGFAYHTVEKIADSDFGLSFAEKTVSEEGISLKGVTYIQRNKIREVTHFKEEQNEFSRASESYFSISATPMDEHIFGKNVDCGKAISFSKSYDLNDKEGKNDFLQLFNEIDTAFYDSEKKSTFPRFKLLEKKDKKNEELDSLLFNILKNERSLYNISLGINRIQLAGNQIEILDAIDKIYVYRIYHPSKKRRIGIDGEELTNFIRENLKDINTLNDLRLSITNNNDEEIKNGPLKDFIFAQIEDVVSGNSKVYLLDEGRWGYFNDRFYQLLDKKLEEINEKVVMNDKYNFEYPIIRKKLEGEDAYIEKMLQDNSNFYKLHKRSISTGGVNIELADIYDSVNDELLTIKRGVKTSTSIYSFEQSILGTRILTNPDEFEVKKSLSKTRKHHNKLDKKIIADILNCRNQRVLWLISDEPNYIFKAVKDKSFNIKDLKSVLLRLKIVDWYTYLQEHTYDIKLYFGLDLPVKEMKNVVKIPEISISE